MERAQHRTGRKMTRVGEGSLKGKRQLGDSKGKRGQIRFDFCFHGKKITAWLFYAAVSSPGERERLE